ncbi:ArnT family glycosyltransferase [Stieleria neptunia]|nr:glycosyltransferase family 39 protein [Stieleria neptunia]
MGTTLDKRELLTVLLIAAFSLLIRLGALSFVDSPQLIGDEVDHFSGAVEFASGKVVTVVPKRPPLYIWISGIVVLVAGEDPNHVRLFQVFVDYTTTIGVYVLARVVYLDLLYSKRIAAIAMLLYAIHPEFIAFSHYLWTETVFLWFLLAGFLLLMRFSARPTVTNAIATGAIWGLSALLKPYQIYMLPLMVAASVVCSPRTEIRRAWRLSLVVLATSWITVLPCCTKNDQGWVVISKQGKRAIQEGTNVYPPTQVDFAYVRALPQSAKSSLGRKDGLLQFALDNPRLIGSRTLLKTGDFLAPNTFLIRHLYMGYYGRPKGMSKSVRLLVVSIAMVSISGLLCLGVLGAVRSMPASKPDRWRSNQGRFLLLSVSYFVLTLLMIIVAVSVSRYRLPVMLACVVFASRSIVGPANESDTKSRSCRKYVVILCLACIVAAWVFRAGTILDAAW